MAEHSKRRRHAAPRPNPTQPLHLTSANATFHHPGTSTHPPLLALTINGTTNNRPTTQTIHLNPQDAHLIAEHLHAYARLFNPPPP